MERSREDYPSNVVPTGLLALASLPHRRWLPASNFSLDFLSNCQGNVLAPRRCDDLNTDWQTFRRRARPNDDRRPAGEIEGHGVAETRQFIGSEGFAMQWGREGTNRTDEDIVIRPERD